MSLVDHLNRSVMIKRKSYTSDSQGGHTFTWATSSTVQGRIRPASDRERTIASKPQAYVTHIAYFDAGVDVQVGDQLVTTAPTALTVYAAGVKNPGGINHHLEVSCSQEQLEP